MTDHPGRLIDLQARLIRGDIDRRGYLARLRALRDAGQIIARAFAQEIADFQRQVLATRGIPADDTAATHRRRAPFSRVASSPDTDDATAPFDKNQIHAGTPTQYIDIEDSIGVASMDDGLKAEPEHRRSEAVHLLRKIVRVNPDASYAASTAKRTAATKWSLRCYEIGPEGPTETPRPTPRPRRAASSAESCAPTAAAGSRPCSK